MVPLASGRERRAALEATKAAVRMQLSSPHQIGGTRIIHLDESLGRRAADKVHEYELAGETILEPGSRVRRPRWSGAGASDSVASQCLGEA